MRSRSASVGTLVACLALVGSVQAQTTLTGGRKLAFKVNASPGKTTATIGFVKDPELVALTSPLCPATSTLRLSSSAQVRGAISLPCANWGIAGGGFQYKDKLGAAGGVQRIVYKGGKLAIKMKGTALAPLNGPVTFAEVRLGIGAARLCGRFTTFKPNEPSRLTGKGPTTACQPICGDGIVDPTELCDDGDQQNGDGCDTNCTPTACGNGVVSGTEACDDGNTDPGDGCRGDCTVEACGDGILDPTEQCDDGNTTDGDCCSSTCSAEDGGTCDDGSNCTTGDVCVGSTCVGQTVKPWINEFDYDDFAQGGNIDRDEFVEIAAPAGTDLGGYTIVAVEGNDGCGFTGFLGVTTGNANFSATIPAGTIVPNDTGLGVGFVVACFSYTSARHVAAGECDVVLPAPSTETNLQNGDLVNQTNYTCPDGILLLDPHGHLADAVSYEGIVPGVGNFGPFFQVAPYNVGMDQGFKTGVSFEKRTQIGRAVATSEWHLSGGCADAGIFDLTCSEFSDSPGRENPGQDLHCPALYCGDGVTSAGEQCDDGAANSDAPDAACRLDCTLRSCGDGVVDPAAGEVCESDGQCTTGETCFGCDCLTGSLLGPLDFSVAPGPSGPNVTDDGESSWLRVTPTLSINNGTQGNFNPGPLKLAAGFPDANGKTPLYLTQTAYIGASVPAIAGSGRACLRIEQDPSHAGEIDCDGGTNYDVGLVVDSAGTGANGTPTLTVGAGLGDSGAGAAVIRVLATAALTPDAVTPCEDADYSPAPTVMTAFTTAIATSTILNPRQGGLQTVVTLGGTPFDCNAGSENGPASVVAPNLNMDVTLPVVGTLDIAQALRLNDQ
jgi:cysteine-rich repeat protein